MNCTLYIVYVIYIIRVFVVSNLDLVRFNLNRGQEIDRLDTLAFNQSNRNLAKRPKLWRWVEASVTQCRWPDNSPARSRGKNTIIPENNLIMRVLFYLYE